MFRKQAALYEIDLSTCPPSCLPIGFDKSRLRDVTMIGDMWRKYVDIDTGRIHDGAVYYERAMNLRDQ